MDVFWGLVAVFAVPTLLAMWGMGYNEWRKRRSRPAIDPAIRGEIEQTMEWWDSEFRKLIEETNPPPRPWGELIEDRIAHIQASRPDVSAVMVKRYR